jgi:hypothetical protein
MFQEPPKQAARFLKEPAEEFEKQVRRLRAKREKKGGRKPKFVEVGGCKVHPSADGTKIFIDGLSAKRKPKL